MPPVGRYWLWVGAGPQDAQKWVICARPPAPVGAALSRPESAGRRDSTGSRLGSGHVLTGDRCAAHPMIGW
jgi:hypothetical protein